MDNVVRLLRLAAVLDSRGRGRSAHYADVKKGLFTPPIASSQRSVRWPDYEVEAINRARIAGKTEEEIKGLVQRLVAQRSSAT